jgi:hypothetical protein
MLARVRGDVHPPLYFALLYGWVRAAGEPVYALRLLSVLFGMIGLAATYAVGRRLFDPATGLIALVILGTASFFVYYTREARMYTLLLALAALATWAYLSWRARPSLLRALIYGLLLAALLYTHYAGALVILTHGLHLVLWSLIFSPRPQAHFTERPAARSFLAPGKFLIPYALALLLYLPWLPIFLDQMRANPNGPLAIPVQTDWAVVAGLVLILVGGGWGLYVAPFVLGRALPRVRRYGSAVLLLVMSLLLTPAALLALNAWVAPVYQVRYTIALLPAGALLVAYGLRWIGWPGVAERLRLPLRGELLLSLLAVIWLALIVHNQLTIYPELWPEKPPWETTIRAMTATRDPLEPTITDIAAYSPAAYYDRRLGIRQGVSLDLAWRLHHYDEIMALIEKFDATPSVWVALPVNTAKSWHIVAALDAGRGATYRSSLVNMIFYRFGDLLRYQSGPGAAERFSVAAGERLCADLELAALGELDGSYSAGLHLVDITGTTAMTQWDAGLGTASAGERLALRPCLDIPAAAAPGYYHLELVVYAWASEERLRLFEDGGGDPLPWGDVLMLAAVDVAG